MTNLIHKILMAAAGCAMAFSMTAVSAEGTDPGTPASPLPSSNNDSYVVSSIFSRASLAGVVINNHYVYCVDENASWPLNGISYYQIEKTSDIAAVQVQLERAMNAGYPIDAFGFSKINNDSALMQAYLTQRVVWAIMGNPDLIKEASGTISPYEHALYEYALKGTVNGKEVKAVSANAAGIVSELSQNTDGTWKGTLTFTADKVSEITISSIPAGIQLFNADRELHANDQVSSSDVLTFTASGEFKNGNFEFTYIKNNRVNENIALFKTDAVNGDSSFQRMIGYQYTQETASMSVILKVTPKTGETEEEPKPSPSPSPEPSSAPSASPVPSAAPTAETVVKEETERAITPVTNETEEQTSEEKERPSTPNTADQTHPAIAAAMLGISLLVMIFSIRFKKKYSR